MMIRHYGRRAGTLFALALCVTVLAFALASPAGAQDGDTIVKLSTAETSVDVGELFDVEVLVENVEHLASFRLDVQYDPTLARPVEDNGQADEADGTEDANSGEESEAEPTDSGEEASEPVPVQGDKVGEFLATSERSDAIICDGPVARDASGDGVRETVTVSCVTGGAPVCVDGPEGASGSGILAVITFEAVDSGEAELQIPSSTLVLDDVEDCDLETGDAIPITHAVEGLTIELQGGSFPTVLVIVIVGVVAAVIVIGGAGFLFFGRRGRQAAE